MGIEERGLRIVARDNSAEGVTTGGGYPCQCEGCWGWRIGVRWEDGELTFPCTNNMVSLGDLGRQLA